MTRRNVYILDRVPSLNTRVSPSTVPLSVLPSSPINDTTSPVTEYLPTRKSTTPSKSSTNVPSSWKCTIQSAFVSCQSPRRAMAASVDGSTDGVGPDGVAEVLVVVGEVASGSSLVPQAESP